MGNSVNLPSGFVLDNDPAGLPPDFVLDKQDEPKTETMSPLLAAPLEAMQAFNNAAYGLIDVVGVDTVNALLNVAGSDTRIPRITDQPLMNQQFMEDGLGRDTAQAVGDTAALATGGGQIIRQAAQKIPKIASNAESTVRGLLRQMQDTGTKGDILIGGLAGAGQAVGGYVGEDLGGPEGRVAGELLGSLGLPLAASGIQSKIQSGKIANEFSKAVPTANDLKGAANPLYKEIDKLKVKVKQEPLGRLYDDIAEEANKQGIDPIVTPKANAVLNRIGALTEKPLSISEIDTMRKVANAAKISIEPSESNLGTMMVGKIDDFVDDLSASALTQQDENVGSLLKEARGLWSRAKKTELINDAIEKAKNQQSGFENGLRTQFRAMLNNKKIMKGFTEDEKKAIQKVVRGGKAENISKALGKFGFADGGGTSMLMATAGIYGGASLGGPAGGAIVPAVGQSFKSLALSLTRNNVKLAKELIAAGPNGKKIAEAYIRSVPKSQRSTEELTALLLNQKASLASIRNSDNKLISDAAYFASSVSVPAGALAEEKE